MIFPVNVFKKTLNTRKLMASDKTSIIVQAFIIGNVLLYIVLHHIFTVILGLSTVWVIIVQVVLFIAVGVIIFRFCIFHEDEKVQEYRNSNSDSFAKFMYVRKEGTHELTTLNRKVSVFEYVNGLALVVLCFRVGSNDDTVATATKKLLQKIFKVAASYGLIIRTFVIPEHIETSKEYKRHVKKMNRVSDKRLATNLKKITTQVVQTSREKCHTEVLYLMLNSQSAFQVEEFESALRAIFSLIDGSQSCFRDVSVLDLQELLEFFRQFYTVDAIDLALMKAIDVSEDVNALYNKVVDVYRFHATDGTEYHMSGDDQFFSVKERKM